MSLAIQGNLVYFTDESAIGVVSPGLILTLLAAKSGHRPFIDWMFIDIDGLTTSPSITVKFGTDTVATITSGDLSLGEHGGSAGYLGPMLGNDGEALTVTFMSSTGTGIVRALVGYAPTKEDGTTSITA